MRVRELVSLLQTLENQDWPIVVDGYESGFKDVTDVQGETVAPFMNVESYYGPHDYSHDEDDPPVTCYRIKGGLDGSFGQAPAEFIKRRYHGDDD